MENLKEYSLNYQFDFHNINELKSGDVLNSNCSPIDNSDVEVTSLTTNIANTSLTTTTSNVTAANISNSNTTNTTTTSNTTVVDSSFARSAPYQAGIIHSTAGFPLEFSLQLVYHKRVLVYYRKLYETDEESQNRTIHRLCLGLRLHQPSSVPYLPPLHIKPVSVPADRDDPHRPSWLNQRQIEPDRSVTWRFTLETPDMLDLHIPLHFSGQFRFELLDEPLRLIDNLPPRSEADWSCLPNEMVSAVLRQLPMYERARARLVCRFWADILDTDASAWNDVIHLQTNRPSGYIVRNDFNDYDRGRLNLVRKNKILQALRFLVSRKAPIRSLEIQLKISEQETDYFQRLSACLSELKISLRALSVQYARGEKSGSDIYLRQMLGAQPSIERLHMGKTATLALSSNPPLALDSLRTLSLTFYNLREFDMFRSSRFRSLEGLRLILFCCDASDAQIGEELESRVPHLRQNKNPRAMENLKEYCLNYQFDFLNIDELKSGDVLNSNCPPIDSSNVDVTSLTTNIANTTISSDTAANITKSNTPSNITVDNSSINGAPYQAGIIHSPAGFPLEFSLQLVYHKGQQVSCLLPHVTDEKYQKGKRHRLSLRLRLHQPSSIPFLPPLHIQPTSVPADYDPPVRPSWLNERQIGPDQPVSWRCTLVTADTSDHDVPLHFSGQLQFHILDEPQRFINNLPPMSEADWSCLPNDMVSAVLRQLPLVERIKARLVCRFWADILDTDALAWNDVIHLQTNYRYDVRNDNNDYDCGRLNFVRNDQILQALRFLVSRKAPIHSLEIRLYISKQGTDYFQRLSACLSEMKISLRVLSMQYFFAEAAGTDAYLTQMLNAQPSIERLHLEEDATLALSSNASLIQFLDRLRVLSLTFYYFPNFDLFQSSRFRSLQGLRLSLIHCGLSDAQIGEAIESRVPHLRQVQSVEWKSGEGYASPSSLCGCSVLNAPMTRQVVFGSGTLSPAAAGYLLMPLHYWMGAWVSHHQI